MEKIAVYNGTFDPVTNGHLDIIERASKIFDKLYVTICVHPKKVGLFSIKERVELLKKATAHLDNVIVDSTDQLAVEYVRSVGASVLIRGLRSTTDFDYELSYAQSNQYLDKNIEIMYLMTKPSHSFISSSVVKEMASYHQGLAGLVPVCVENALKDKFR
ncbi:MAG: pantetheine-phosphate adenylyltransferase [Faecalibacillus sp.]